jgi:hypothetical protein
MPVLRFLGSLRPSDEGLLFVPDPEFDPLVKTALADIRVRAAKKREADPSFKTQFEVVAEWHYRKRSLDQNKLLWALIGAMARVISASGGKRTKDELYEDWLDSWAPRARLTCTALMEGHVRQLLHRIIDREVTDGGYVSLRGIVGSSQWDVPTMARGIQYWFDELATMGIGNDIGADVGAWWREWRTDLSRRGVDLADVNAAVSIDDYRALHLQCESCGKYIGTEGGEIAHISARGMGGGSAHADRVGNILHLCIECHRLGTDAQHQKGWGPLLKRAPWLKSKVLAALGETEDTDDAKM